MRVFPLWMEVLGRPEAVIEGIDLAGITLERLKQEHTVPIRLESTVPFADLNFPTSKRQWFLLSLTKI